MEDRQYPKSFDDRALWTSHEICGYLGIKLSRFYEIEPKLKTFKVGRSRVAFAKDVIAYAETVQRAQNPIIGGLAVGR